MLNHGLRGHFLFLTSICDRDYPFLMKGGTDSELNGRDCRVARKSKFLYSIQGTNHRQARKFGDPDEIRQGEDMRRRQKIFLFLLLFGSLAVVSSFSSSSQKTEPLNKITATKESEDFWGKWEGFMEGKIKLQLVFEIVKNKDNTLQCLYSMPLQGLNGEPVQSFSIEGTTVNITIPLVMFTYSGSLKEDHLTIEGVLIWRGESGPKLILKKVINISSPFRPQTPQKPYPYMEQDVKFSNLYDNIVLAGTLTYPRSGGPFPAAILISGAGPQDRNEEGFGGHRFFQVLADDLTKRGIAVLRYDDRGTAKSTGKYYDATVFDFANDAEAGLDFLKTIPFIDKDKIGFIGHSEGGFVAQIVGGRRAETAFIILMAGPVMPTVDILKFQMKGASDRTAVLGEKTENITALLDNALDIALKEEGMPAVRNKMASLFNNSNLPDEQKKSFTDMFCAPEMIFAVKTNPADYLAKVKCPILALGGTKDMAVPAKENHEALRQIMAKLGHSNYEIVEFPNMNHFFQTTTNGMFYYVPQIKETMSPVAMKTMGDWILKTMGKKTN